RQSGEAASSRGVTSSSGAPLADRNVDVHAGAFGTDHQKISARTRGGVGERFGDNLRTDAAHVTERDGQPRPRDRTAGAAGHLTDDASDTVLSSRMDTYDRRRSESRNLRMPP